MSKTIRLLGIFLLSIWNVTADDSAWLKKIIVDALNCHNYYYELWANDIVRNVRVMPIDAQTYLVSLDRDNNVDSPYISIREVTFGRDHILLLMVDRAEKYGRFIRLDFYSSSEILQENTSPESVAIGIPYSYRQQIRISPQKVANFIAKQGVVEFPVALSAYTPVFVQNHIWREWIIEIESALYRMVNRIIRNGRADVIFASEEYENVRFIFENIDYRSPMVRGRCYRKARGKRDDIFGWISIFSVDKNGLDVRRIDFLPGLTYDKRIEETKGKLSSCFTARYGKLENPIFLSWRVTGDKEHYRLELEFIDRNMEPAENNVSP